MKIQYEYSDPYSIYEKSKRGKDYYVRLDYKMLRYPNTTYLKGAHFKELPVITYSHTHYVSGEHKDVSYNTHECVPYNENDSIYLANICLLPPLKSLVFYTNGLPIPSCIENMKILHFRTDFPREYPEKMEALKLPKSVEALELSFVASQEKSEEFVIKKILPLVHLKSLEYKVISPYADSLREIYNKAEIERSDIQYSRKLLLDFYSKIPESFSKLPIEELSVNAYLFDTDNLKILTQMKTLKRLVILPFKLYGHANYPYDYIPTDEVLDLLKKLSFLEVLVIQNPDGKPNLFEKSVIKSIKKALPKTKILCDNLKF